MKICSISKMHSSENSMIKKNPYCGIEYNDLSTNAKVQK